MESRVEQLVTVDGWRLHLGVFEPPGGGAPRSEILAIPAMMVGRRSLDRPRGGGLASWLATAGHRVWTLDLRGHGDSRPGAAEGADWTYDDLVGIDIPAAIAHVRRAARGAPVVVLGHSLGAHGSAAALGSRGAPEVDGLVLIAGNIWTAAFEPDPWRLARKRAAIAAWVGLSRGVGRFPTRTLGWGSDDEALSYVSDFARWVWGDWTGRDGVDYTAGLARVTGPVLALAAAGDRLMCHPDCARAFAAHLVSADVELVEVGAASWHGATEPAHMTLVTERASWPVWARIDRWIDRWIATAAAPGRAGAGLG